MPSNPLRPSVPDDHYAREAETAGALGVPVALIDHDAAAQGDAVHAVRRVSVGGRAVYRGWMLSSEQYRQLSDALAARSVTLVTDPVHYRTAHELPGWYSALRRWTPMSFWTDTTDIDTGLAELSNLAAGAAVLRDYTKSLKDYWLEAAYIPDSSDTATARGVLERFRDLRGPDLAGGFVLRQYEVFEGPETRTWWVDGRCVLITSHPNEPERAADETVPADLVRPAVERLGCWFVAVDFIRRSDGEWRVVELGDGQVSDLPGNVDASRLLAPVLNAGAGEGNRGC